MLSWWTVPVCVVPAGLLSVERPDLLVFDGPEFDAHQIDFNEMLSRLGGFKGAETEKMEEFVHHGECALSDRNADWRKALRETVKAKERTMIERVKMPERTPQERISSQRLEVNTGLTKEMAMQEARRCQDCANRPVWKAVLLGSIFQDLLKISSVERFLKLLPY